MATIVLGAVGTLIGGPIGGAIGAMLGQGVDARILGPRGRKGPRLDELRVQTSSYGAAIPRIYGRMRVSGTVIWATDLIEHKKRQSNGKGRGSTTNYSYSLSFAVALSSRPIRQVRRIWAEGNLLRGADGAFKTPTLLRLHQGHEDQEADPLIVAAEGADAAPAYRGIAYALFEGFDLAPFGNRVPSLTFEVEADEEPIACAMPVADMLGGASVAEPGPTITGCAIAADSRAAVADAFAPLAAVARRAGEGWRIGSDAAEVPVQLGEPAGSRPESRMVGDDGVPRRLVLSAYDPARDYQMGESAARVAGGAGAAERLALPIAMAAPEVKGLAAALARRAAMERREVRWPQGFGGLALRLHDRVRLPGEAGAMLVHGRRIGADGVQLTLRAHAPLTEGALAADGGRAALAPDLSAGVSRAALFDLPAMTAGDGGAPKLVLAAAGGPGWRSGLVRLRPAAGASAIELGAARAALVLGTVEAASPAATAGLIDRAGSIVVALGDAGATLDTVSDADLIGGANLAAAGGELLQFGSAEPLGAGRWRLARLLRGRFATLDRAAAAGDDFTVLDDPALFPIPAAAGLAPVTVGGAVSVEGSGDAAPVERTISAIGRAMLPLAPVHARTRWQADGALQLRWTRASRGGFTWIDGIDAPLDASREAYRLSWSAGGLSGVMESAVPEALVTAEEIAAMRAGAGTLSLAIVQVGDHGPSPALHHAVAL